MGSLRGEPFHETRAHLPNSWSANLATLGPVIAACCEIKAELCNRMRPKRLAHHSEFRPHHWATSEAISHYGKYLHGDDLQSARLQPQRLSPLKVAGLPCIRRPRVINPVSNVPPATETHARLGPKTQG